jgi:[ribosomal protein S5]-alanine N-acetyltransferase
VQTLETKRLILREWQTDDVNDLVEGLNNIEVSKWLAAVPYPYTKQDAEDYINYCLSKPNGSYNFAIVLKSVDKVIGGLSLERINEYQGTSGGGGIWISTKYHGHGYGTEAFGKRIDFAFNELKLRRLENGFFEGNFPSKKMQESFGYIVEGKKRKGYLCKADGKYKDEFITGLLKEEWISPKREGFFEEMV